MRRLVAHPTDRDLVFEWSTVTDAPASGWVRRDKWIDRRIDALRASFEYEWGAIGQTFDERAARAVYMRIAAQGGELERTIDDVTGIGDDGTGSPWTRETLAEAVNAMTDRQSTNS